MELTFFWYLAGSMSSAGRYLVSICYTRNLYLADQFVGLFYDVDYSSDLIGADRRLVDNYEAR